MNKADVLNPALSLYIHAQVGRSRQALVVGDRVLTYEDLATEAGRVAAWLRSRPWRRGSDRIPRVGILAARTPEAYAGVLGTLWAGGTYFPLGLDNHPVDLFSLIATRADLDAVVIDPGAVRLVEELGPALPPHVLVGPNVELDLPHCRVTPWAALADLPPADPPSPLGPDHPAYVLFCPEPMDGNLRGVVVSAASLAHFLMAMRALYQFGPKDRFAQFADISSNALLYEMFACLDGGGCVHVVPPHMLETPAVFLKQRNITAWVSDPAVIPMMARKGLLKRGAFPWLRVSLFTGDGLPIESAKAWAVAAPHSIVDNHYGPPEVTAAALLQRLTNPPIETPGRGTLPLGEPFPAIAAEIVNAANGEFLPPNQPGELAFSGPQLSLGYLTDEGLTARRFPTLFHPRLGYTRWFLTGHPATRDEQGLFHSPGHIDNQVKVLGHRVAMEEV